MVVVDLEQALAVPPTLKMNSTIGIGQSLGMWSIFNRQIWFAESTQVSSYKLVNDSELHPTFTPF